MAIISLIESAQTKVEVKKIDENGDIYVEGIFATYGKKNLNSRIYPKSVMEKAVNAYNDEFIIKRKRSVGELDHPEDSSPQLKNVACYIVEPLQLKEDGTVWGKAKILKDMIPSGHNAAVLIKEGIDVGMSSRGLGEVNEKKVMNEDGSEEIINEVCNYQICCFDIVSEPSIGHFLSKPRKQEENIKKEEKKIEEKKSLSVNDLLNISKILFEE